MNEPYECQVVPGNRLGARGVAAGILAASLVFIPPRFDALNFFDPVKRLVWALLAVALAGLVWRRPYSVGAVDGRDGARPSKHHKSPWSSQMEGRPLCRPNLKGGRNANSCRARIVLTLAVSLTGWMILRSLLRPVPTAELGVLASWCLPILLFCLGAGLALNRQDKRIIGGFLVTAGLIQAVLMILQRMGIDPLFAATTAGMDYAPGRMIGTIGYQNQAVDCLTLSMLGILLLTASPGWFMCGAMLTAPVVLLTGYRGGILAFATGVLFSGTLIMLNHPRLRDNRFRLATVAGALVLFLVVLAIAITLIPRTRTRFREAFTDFETAPAIQSRLYMGRIGWQMFRERPVTGWGAGEYALQYLDRLGRVLPDEKDHTILRSVVFAREAHNDPLQFAVEFGLLGMTLLAVLLVTGFRLSAARDCAFHEARIVAAYGFCYMSVAALFSFPWQSAMAGPLAGLLLGICLPSRVPVGDASKMRPLQNLAVKRSGRSPTLHNPCDPVVFKLEGRPPCRPPEGLQDSQISRVSWHCRNTLLLLMAVALLGWFGRDAYLNLAIPAKLAVSDTEAATQRLSRLDYRYHALVGASQATQGQDDAALTALRHAWLGYRDVLLWNNLGHVLARQGRWDAAKAVYNTWAASGLDHANALRNLSVASEQVGDFPVAAESLRSHMTLWPQATAIHDIKRLAVLQMRAGQPHDAAATVRAYQAIWQQADDPKTIAEMENLAGSIARMLGDNEQAARWFRSALERYPALESARRNLDIH